MHLQIPRFQKPPASVQATWPPQNLLNPPERGNANIIINCIFYPLVVLVLALRVFTRLRVSSSFGVNDILICAALVPATVFFIVSLLADLAFEWKRHLWDIPWSSAPRGLKTILVAQVMFATGITLTKLSILTLIKRIHTQTTNYPFYRRLLNLFITIVILQGTIFILVVIFQCRPPQRFWELSETKQPECVSQVTVLLVGGIINTLTDFAVVLIPVKTVLGLDLPGRQKWVVVGLFGLGLIGAGAGVARTYYTFMVSRTWDQTWAAYPVWLTSALELYIGMICCSIPATKPFFSKYFPKLLNLHKTTEVDIDSHQLYDFSNKSSGGEIGRARLEANRVFLRRTSLSPRDSDGFRFKPWESQRSQSVFEE